MNLVQLLFSFRRLRRNVRLPRSELERIQAQKLQTLVRHAYHNVGYYRELLDAAGVRPEDIKEAGDLTNIPITTKEVLQDLPLDARVAKGVEPDRCFAYYTSGSTGKPLSLLLDPMDFLRQTLLILRTYMEIGYKATGKYAYVGATHESDRPQYGFQSLGLFRSRYICALDDIDTQIRELQHFKPDLLVTYPSVLRLLAQKVRDDKIGDIVPEVIGTGAEVLDKDTKLLAQTVFQAPVRDLYSTVECGNIAFECERGGYHLNMDSLIVECIRNGQPLSAGERGEVVITNLDLFTTPFIRYNLGDICVLGNGACPCGRELPIIHSLEGRSDECVRLPGGEKVPGIKFILNLRFLTALKEFRIIQESPDSLLVELVKGPGFNAGTIRQVKKEIQRLVGEKLNIKLKMVHSIARGRTGKLRCVVSKIE
jgi:phenylacetate-CoA ligase